MDFDLGDDAIDAFAGEMLSAIDASLGAALEGVDEAAIEAAVVGGEWRRCGHLSEFAEMMAAAERDPASGPPALPTGGAVERKTADETIAPAPSASPLAVATHTGEVAGYAFAAQLVRLDDSVFLWLGGADASMGALDVAFRTRAAGVA